MISETVVLAKNPKGYRTLSVSGTAIALSAATGGIPKGASRAVISVETDAIRWRDDGTNPSATVGMPVAKDTSFELVSRAQINAFKAIKVTNDAALNIAYYGE